MVDNAIEVEHYSHGVLVLAVLCVVLGASWQKWNSKSAFVCGDGDVLLRFLIKV